jgi:hypothetical protein
MYQNNSDIGRSFKFIVITWKESIKNRIRQLDWSLVSAVGITTGYDLDVRRVGVHYQCRKTNHRHHITHTIVEDRPAARQRTRTQKYVFYVVRAEML